jgi:hypothetical protein
MEAEDSDADSDDCNLATRSPLPMEKSLLTFQQDCIEELLQSDGLSVIGQGLGMCTVAAALLAVHHLAAESGGAVIMIGTTHMF